MKLIIQKLLFRFVPKDQPPSQVFKDPLVRVDVSIDTLNREFLDEEYQVVYLFFF